MNNLAACRLDHSLIIEYVEENHDLSRWENGSISYFHGLFMEMQLQFSLTSIT